ncbi:MAG: hypothetical protein QNK83_11760 [Akkermansiaceae bacterium]
MGQQLRTNTKRRRRKDYLKRKKEQAKNSAAVKKSAPKAEKAPAKKAAKKVAKKAAKKVETPAAEQDLGKVYDKAPDNVDDLKKIGGVGPALEGKLNGFGVYTFEQIAAWTPANIAAFDDLLSFKGRIERDDWLKQAKEFAAAE